MFLSICYPIAVTQQYCMLFPVSFEEDARQQPFLSASSPQDGLLPAILRAARAQELFIYVSRLRQHKTRTQAGGREGQRAAAGSMRGRVQRMLNLLNDRGVTDAARLLIGHAANSRGHVIGCAEDALRDGRAGVC